MSLGQRKLGNQGLEVSAIGLGCMGLSQSCGPANEAESIVTLHRAIEPGCIFFNTVEVYGPFRNEELIGRAFKGRRGEVVIATKFGFRFKDGKEVAGTMGDLVEQGKVRFFELSEADISNIRRTHSNGFMKPYALFLSLAVLALSSCGSFNPSANSGFGQNDFAVRVASPNGAELSLAQKRLQNFLRRANARQRELLGQNPVVAVQANQIDASEVPGLIYQLSSGQIGKAIAYYASDPDNPTAVPVKFLVLFDSRTGRLVSPGGVLVIDTPPRGIVADFGGVKAVYAGTGWW